MRIIPFVLYSTAKYGTDNYGKLWELAEAGSSLTHKHIRSVIACQIYASILAALIDNPTKDAVCEAIIKYNEMNETEAELIYYKRLDPKIITSLKRSDIKSSGYVVDTLEAAVWCLLTTNSYKECVLTAVNLGSDTDTVAAIAGGLAGALYGLDGIPKEWLNVLKKRDYIESLCDNFSNVWKG